jgi:hypothetical protein
MSDDELRDDVAQALKDTGKPPHIIGAGSVINAAADVTEAVINLRQNDPKITDQAVIKDPGMQEPLKSLQNALRAALKRDNPVSAAPDSTARKHVDDILPRLLAVSKEYEAGSPQEAVRFEPPPRQWASSAEPKTPSAASGLIIDITPEGPGRGRG